MSLVQALDYELTQTWNVCLVWVVHDKQSIRHGYFPTSAAAASYMNAERSYPIEFDVRTSLVLKNPKSGKYRFIGNEFEVRRDWI